MTMPHMRVSSRVQFSIAMSITKIIMLTMGLGMSVACLSGCCSHPMTQALMLGDQTYMPVKMILMTSVMGMPGDDGVQPAIKLANNALALDALLVALPGINPCGFDNVVAAGLGPLVRAAVGTAGHVIEGVVEQKIERAAEMLAGSVPLFLPAYDAITVRGLRCRH